VMNDADDNWISEIVNGAGNPAPESTTS